MMRIEAATAEHGLTAWDFRNGLADVSGGSGRVRTQKGCVIRDPV